MSNIVMKAFTVEYNTIANRLITHADIVYNRKKVFHTFSALWDTGATDTCISKKVVNALNLKPVNKKMVASVLEIKECWVYTVDIILDNDVMVSNVQVCETVIDNQNIDLLIGMDVIQRGNFIISNSEGKTKFSFSMPAKID